MRATTKLDVEVRGCLAVDGGHARFQPAVGVEAGAPGVVHALGLHFGDGASRHLTPRHLAEVLVIRVRLCHLEEVELGRRAVGECVVVNGFGWGESAAAVLEPAFGVEPGTAWGVKACDLRRLL